MALALPGQWTALNTSRDFVHLPEYVFWLHSWSQVTLIQIEVVQAMNYDDAIYLH